MKYHNFILITIEQVIKIVIYNNYFDKRFPILSSLLYFEPKFNRQYSWLNSMLQLGVGKWIHIAIVVMVIILFYLFYQYLNKKLLTNKTIDIIYVFGFSGALCSLIDKVFWDGSLDYILIKGFFTFDLKDLYLSVTIVMLIILSLLETKSLKIIDDNNIVKDFTNYLLRKS